MAINDYLRTSSLDIYDSIAFKNIKEKARYNRLLLGTATRAEVGQDVEANNPTARPPSWTQHAAGLSHGFVIQPLSASNHEERVLNARLSGTVAIESSPVPASGAVYYSKNRLMTVTYKVTGSATWPTGDNGAEAGGFSSVSGTLMSSGSSVVTPFVVPFQVAERGKIVDIKVWVELVSRSGGLDVFGPLSAMAVALRSPNVRFDSSIPIMNDLSLNRVGYTSDNFFRNSFLLWVGAQIDDVILDTISTVDSHHTWNRDRHMRTVFSDSAHPLDGYNPRNLASSHGGFFATVTASSPSSNYAANSPNGSKIGGNDWPWMSDARIQEGGSHGAAGSPPPGWLTGPGGTAAVNEWPTTGSNYGPAMMTPMYPLLDDVLEEKCVESIRREATYNYGANDPTLRDSGIHTRRGVRPGLRGSQSQGKWELLICNMDLFSTIPQMMLYFRQARLELTIDVGEGTSRTLPRKIGFERRSSPKPVAIMSGAYFGSGSPTVFGHALNKFRNIVYTLPRNDYHSTVGITDNTGSFATNFAVFTRITGALAAKYSGSNMAEARYRFLNNEFGTPFIPLSSGSGEPVTSELFERIDVGARDRVFQVINPSLLSGNGLTLLSAKSLTRTSRTTRDAVLVITSGSS